MGAAGLSKGDGRPDALVSRAHTAWRGRDGQGRVGAASLQWRADEEVGGASSVRIVLFRVVLFRVVLFRVVLFRVVWRWIVLNLLSEPLTRGPAPDHGQGVSGVLAGCRVVELVRGARRAGSGVYGGALAGQSRECGVFAVSVLRADGQVPREVDNCVVRLQGAAVSRGASGRAWVAGGTDTFRWDAGVERGDGCRGGAHEDAV